MSREYIFYHFGRLFDFGVGHSPESFALEIRSQPVGKARDAYLTAVIRRSHDKSEVSSIGGFEHLFSQKIHIVV